MVPRTMTIFSSQYVLRARNSVKSHNSPCLIKTNALVRYARALSRRRKIISFLFPSLHLYILFRRYVFISKWYPFRVQQKHSTTVFARETSRVGRCVCVNYVKVERNRATVFIRQKTSMRRNEQKEALLTRVHRRIRFALTMGIV